MIKREVAGLPGQVLLAQQLANHLRKQRATLNHLGRAGSCCKARACRWVGELGPYPRPCKSTHGYHRIHGRTNHLAPCLHDDVINCRHVSCAQPTAQAHARLHGRERTSHGHETALNEELGVRLQP